ncbi:MAG: sirohydrochlorin chelatase, partial [Rhodospirillaceae bacterium]
EILNKKNIMNCDLCKYKEIVLGFESEVGTPQQSHHHHVEGQGAIAPGSNISDCVLCDKFCTGMCRLEQEKEHFHHKHDNHSHGHQHPIYPKADHPLGPNSVRELKK